MGTEDKKVQVKSFEDKLGRLDEIVKKMESGELPLDESLKLFEEGVSLSRQCQSDIDAVEQKVEVLLNSETKETEKFEPQG